MDTVRAPSRASLWLPVLIWCAAIFVMSTRVGAFDPAMLESPFYSLDIIFRKFCHVFEYAVLYGLLDRAVDKKEGEDGRMRALFILALTVAYAASDEFHQSMVPGRSGKLSDVFVDFLGAAAARARLPRLR